MMETALRYMYGFDILGEGGHRDLDSIQDFAVLGAIAEKFEIVGLSSLVLTTASCALDDCLGDAGKLECFLLFGHPSSSVLPHFDYAVKIFAYNLAKLRKHEVFQALLNKEHELAVALLNVLAESQDHVQGGNGGLE